MPRSRSWLAPRSPAHTGNAPALESDFFPPGPRHWKTWLPPSGKLTHGFRGAVHLGTHLVFPRLPWCGPGFSRAWNACQGKSPVFGPADVVVPRKSQSKEGLVRRTREQIQRLLQEAGRRRPAAGARRAAAGGCAVAHSPDGRSAERVSREPPAGSGRRGGGRPAFRRWATGM
jgi:hypothetical protein